MALTDKLRAIGDAIRLKRDITTPMTLDEMPLQISLIEGGGGTTNSYGIEPIEGTYELAEERTETAALDIYTANNGTDDWQKTIGKLPLGKNVRFEYVLEYEGIYDGLCVKKSRHVIAGSRDESNQNRWNGAGTSALLILSNNSFMEYTMGFRINITPTYSNITLSLRKPNADIAIPAGIYKYKVTVYDID